MTLEQFRAKWGLVFGSMLICELVTRIDSNGPLTTAGNELADDLRKLLAAEKTPEKAPDFTAATSFPRRLERLDSINSGEKS
jgi:hypothetical protein